MARAAPQAVYPIFRKREQCITLQYGVDSNSFPSHIQLSLPLMQYVYSTEIVFSRISQLSSLAGGPHTKPGLKTNPNRKRTCASASLENSTVD